MEKFMDREELISKIECKEGFGDTYLDLIADIIEEKNKKSVDIL